jgi:hypothetical protein
MLTKNGDPIPIIQDDTIIYADDNKVLKNAPLTLTNLILFFDGMRLCYNNGNRTQDVVTFAGADFVEDMQIKCKIRLSNDSTILVDPETLNYLENPDIASIPQTSEAYCQEIQSVNPSQVKHLLMPKGSCLFRKI